MAYVTDAERQDFHFRVDGVDAITWLTPGEPVNDYGTDGIYLDATRGIWRVVHDNRLHPCEWPYEYRVLAEQCYADLCNPQPENRHHFRMHPYDYDN